MGRLPQDAVGAGPTVAGRVLVRGRRVDGHGEVRFQVGRERPRHDLHLPTAAGRRSHWRYFPTASVLTAAGCWAFQIDAAKFSRVVVFRVVAPARPASTRRTGPERRVTAVLPAGWQLVEANLAVRSNQPQRFAAATFRASPTDP